MWGTTPKEIFVGASAPPDWLRPHAQFSLTLWNESGPAPGKVN